MLVYSEAPEPNPPLRTMRAQNMMLVAETAARKRGGVLV